MPEKICIVTSREPFEYTLSVMSGKWKLRIIYVLACMGTVRYGELKKNIDEITHKMLSFQLKELENENIVLRNEYPQIPPKVEYSLTVKGKSLIPIVMSMCDWEKNIAPIMRTPEYVAISKHIKKSDALKRIK